MPPIVLIAVATVLRLTASTPPISFAFDDPVKSPAFNTYSPESKKNLIRGNKK